MRVPTGADPGTRLTASRRSGVPDPAENDANTAWVRDFYDATAPHSEAGGYINFMADDDQERIKDNYKGNYDRLVDVKRQYDPENVFHLNHNIVP